MHCWKMKALTKWKLERGSHARHIQGCNSVSCDDDDVIVCKWINQI
jgi:hypothetical protein